jgi:hypothetical protein
MTKKNTNVVESRNCNGLSCHAGGPAEDGGHLFDVEIEGASSAACKCGMDQMTYDAFIKYASWR